MADSAAFQSEMGYTAEEFSDVLHGNFTGARSEFQCMDQHTNTWLITNDNSGMRVEIYVSQQPPRELGAIALPVLDVHFKVSASSPEETDHFFDKFFKYFHKGGG